MNVKHSLVAVGVASALLAAPLAQAGGWSEVSYANARVVGVEPITQTVQMRGPAERTCWTETRTRQVTRPQYDSGAVGNTIIGAVIGGVIGHQFGHDGRYTASTAAGALLGGAIGNNLSQRGAQTYTVSEPVQRCEVRHSRRTVQQVVAYRVSYRYRGQVYTTRMPYEPGRFIRVRVSERVTPVH
ncbi:MAG: glycine zipper 2TM domain-containing protein [Acidihalobacter sp.]